jgi:hypothetical protein
MSGTSATATAPTEELVEYAWRPQPGPQKALVDCPYPEILMGGARGGAKTDGILGKYALKEKRWGRYFNGVFFRQEMPQQDDLIERAKEIYCRMGAAYQESRKQFLLPHGGRLRFRPLESIIDAQKYQGQSLSDAAVEEAGNYPMPDPIDMLFGCLRSAHGVPVQLILSANPGGPGHQWLKQRYIDPAPNGFVRLVRKLPNGAEHFAVFIKSLITDNKILLQKDPDYINRLYLVGSPELVRAWLEGDWSVIAGAFFPEFSTRRHVIAPFAIPEHWARIRAMDWGSAKPFCVLWLAVSDGTVPGIARGALVAYREWYGWNGKPNVGCQLPAPEVGRGIIELETVPDESGVLAREMIADEVLDPAAFARDGGPSIVERMDVRFRRADNARVARRGAMGGWDQVRERLKGDGERPQLLIFSTCTHLIRTLPALPHDKHRPEDVDTEAEDHAPDALRYGCMARPLIRDKPGTPPPRFETQLTVNELIKRARQRRISGE